MPTVAHRIFEDPISHPQDEAPLDAYSRAVAGVADRVGPAVVRVESTDQNQRHGGVGSGVIIAGDGLVITNSHVIGDARRVRLTFAEGGEGEAQVSGTISTPTWPSYAHSCPPERGQQRSATPKPCGADSSSSRLATRLASSRPSRPG